MKMLAILMLLALSVPSVFACGEIGDGARFTGKWIIQDGEIVCEGGNCNPATKAETK